MSLNLSRGRNGSALEAADSLRAMHGWRSKPCIAGKGK
jgi:hypothetical protein